MSHLRCILAVIVHTVSLEYLKSKLPDARTAPLELLRHFHRSCNRNSLHRSYLSPHPVVILTTRPQSAKGTTTHTGLHTQVLHARISRALFVGSSVYFRGSLLFVAVVAAVVEMVSGPQFAQLIFVAESIGPTSSSWSCVCCCTTTTTGPCDGCVSDAAFICVDTTCDNDGGSAATAETREV